MADFVYVNAEGKKVGENSPDKVQKFSPEDYELFVENQKVAERLRGDATGRDAVTGLVTTGTAKGKKAGGDSTAPIS